MATKEQHRNWPGLKAFQSTPPSRVATLLAQAGRIYVFISIHTTLAGGDIGIRIPPHSSYTFQSTPPSRVATAYVGTHKPRPKISIHTTLAGGDTPRWRIARLCIDFNPHHPRGWRQGQYLLFLLLLQFQSTPPSRVATIIINDKMDALNISIHTTLAGGDTAIMKKLQMKKNFNPHHPRGWRHPPAGRMEEKPYFNPHHPRGWRRPKPSRTHRTQRFQSTPPSRVATNSNGKSNHRRADFNPHHPRGWRRS